MGGWDGVGWLEKLEIKLSQLKLYLKLKFELSLAKYQNFSIMDYFPLSNHISQKVLFKFIKDMNSYKSINHVILCSDKGEDENF